MSKLPKVLLLGSGLVAKPGAQYLAENGFEVIVASRNFEKAMELCEKAKKDSKNLKLPIFPVKFDVESDDQLLSDLVKQCDYVVSLLPYVFHVKVAREAIGQKKHFFTTSYVSDGMRALQEEALKAGVIVVNECGVDPGTDHMSAKRVIDDVHSRGGKVVSFTSYCGGLPSPDSNDNPFGYKLSWAPRGVLLASRNDARFVSEGKDVLIPGSILFDNYKLFNIEGLGEFEGYPNRDSKQYIDVYGIPEVQSIVRGTFRNKGWCATIKKISDLGYLSTDEIMKDNKDFQEGRMTYAQLMRETLVTLHSVRLDGNNKEENIRSLCAKFLNLQDDNAILDRLEWIGLFSQVEKVPSKTLSRLDALCHLFKEKLQYRDGEADMLLMQHYFIVDLPSATSATTGQNDDLKTKGRREHITSTLIDYGIKNGDTSMSRTVSLPVAIAVKLVATGKINLVGLQVPIVKELYEPILNELQTMGIKFIEKIVKIE